jgi:hypothetical protein
MATLILTSSPGFAEVPDSTFDGGNPASAANFKALNSAAKFAAVRTEEFWGFYKNAETVVLPVSVADGYAYAREELQYTYEIFHTGGAPATPLAGSQVVPGKGAGSGPGNLLAFGFVVGQATGLVVCNVSYYVAGGAQTDTNDGILIVHTCARRQR